MSAPVLTPSTAQDARILSSAPSTLRVITRRDRLLAALLVLCTTLLLQVASRTQGFTRDEGFYFQAAEYHAHYLEDSLSGVFSGHPLAFANRALVDRWHSFNSEHPPLMKTLFGISWRLLHRCTCPKEPGLHPLAYPTPHRTLGLLSQAQAMRLPAHVLTGFLVAGLYLFGALTLGRYVGLLAALFTLFQPRVLFHSQLSCFDAPVTAMIFLTTLSYLYASLPTSRSTEWRRAVLFSLVLALALLTKLNAFFLPPILLIHSLWLRRAVLRSALADRGADRRQGIRRWLLPPWALCAATLTPLFYVLGWPHLWFDTLQRFNTYAAFHLHHVHYNLEYLGTNYNRPPYPWHYVPVMTLLTQPVVVLFLAAVALSVWLAEARKTADSVEASSDRRGARVLILLGIAWPMLLIMRPGTPIFGAEKHWMPATPFLALLAAAGLFFLMKRLQQQLAAHALGARAIPLVLAVLALLPPVVETARSHPYGLSHYNALAGGPQGGAELGMNRQFWGYAVRGVLPTLNTYARHGAVIYFHDANWPALQMYMKEGVLRRDLRDSGLEEPGVVSSELGLVIHERHFNKYEYWLWDAYGKTQPLAVATHYGVPVATLYARPPRTQCPIAP